VEHYCCTLQTLDDTIRLGYALGHHARPGDVICLDGDLGAGKTTLCQAVANGLGVPSDCYVTSPSFAILHEYPGRMVMYHMDFYRLADAGEVIDLGFEEYFYLSGLTVIEWSQRASELLPETHLHLQMAVDPHGFRTVVCSSPDPAWQDRLLQVMAEAKIACSVISR
jgi:tRNA threonylcarbamoyladenosine biosynthesis protein TsaE